MALAEDFRLAFSNQGNFILQIKHPSIKEGIDMEVPMFAHLIRAGLLSIATSPSADVRAHSQMVSIRDISAGTPHPTLVSLKYSLECGVQLETSMDLHDARTLRDGLSAAIQLVETQPPPKIQ